MGRLVPNSGADFIFMSHSAKLEKDLIGVVIYLGCGMEDLVFTEIGRGGGVGWGCRENVFIEGLRDWESESGYG